MVKYLIFASVLFLSSAKEAFLDVDFTWEINVPEEWERKAAVTENVRTYSYFPDAHDEVSSNLAFFYDSSEPSKGTPRFDRVRGISIMFASEATPVIFVVNNNPVTVKVDFFGKEMEARRCEYKTEKGIRYQYVIVTNVHAFPDEAFGESDPVIISVICSSAEEFSAYKKMVETIRRKGRPKDATADRNTRP